MLRPATLRAATSHLIVVFEGLDNSGKSTQARRLCQALSLRHVPNRLTGVFQTAFGRQVREWFMDPQLMQRASYMTQVFLLASAMNQLREEVAAICEPVVVLDRFIYTTYAYHGGGLRMGIPAVKEVYSPVASRLTPDLVFLLDVPPSSAAARKAASDRIEAGDEAFFCRVREAYHEALRGVESAHILDGTRSIDEIHATVLATVLQRLDLGGARVS